MRRLTYALQFYRPAGAAPQPIVASGDCVVTITPVCVTGEVGTLGQFQTAAVETHPTKPNPDGSFTETGVVTFGDPAGNNTLRFSSIHNGYMNAYACPEAPFTAGTVMWGVESGEGFFAGATGAITSNFLIDLTQPHGQDGVLIAYHFGVVYLP